MFGVLVCIDVVKRIYKTFPFQFQRLITPAKNDRTLSALFNTSTKSIDTKYVCSN